jgi:hypothetical protein
MLEQRGNNANSQPFTPPVFPPGTHQLGGRVAGTGLEPATSRLKRRRLTEYSVLFVALEVINFKILKSKVANNMILVRFNEFGGCLRSRSGRCNL